MNSLYTGLFTLLLLCKFAHAEGLHAVRPLPGYVCLKLALSPEQVADPTRGVPIRDAPALSGHIVGWVPSVVIAPASQQPNSGFIQVLFPDGRRGWTQTVALKPWSSDYNPDQRCIPSVMSNGLIAFDFRK